MPNLTLRQHQKLIALFETERVRLRRLLWSLSVYDQECRDSLNKEMEDLFDLRNIILDLPHESSHSPSEDIHFQDGIPNEYGGQTLAGNP